MQLRTSLALLIALAVLTTVSRAAAYWTPAAIGELVAESDAIVVVRILGISDGAPAPPADPSSRSVPPADAARARNHVRARVLRVLRGCARPGEVLQVDVPWAFTRDVTPLRGPSFSADERLLLFLRTDPGRRPAHRLVRDDDGKYEVDSGRYRHALVRPMPWATLAALERSIPARPCAQADTRAR
jgi:hypothetical protein